MGGFGSMNIAIHHPEVFGSVIALGGYYRAEEAVWGPDQRYRTQNSPLLLLPHKKDAWKLHIYLGAATNDIPYITDTRQFIQELKQFYIPYRLDLQQGAHSWNVWSVQLYNALIWLQPILSMPSLHT